jgi:3-oxoacyl-[acyl-carrier protein] reductase
MCAADLKAPLAIEELLEQAFANQPGLKHLVINAGIWSPSSLFAADIEHPDDQVRDQLELHITASFRLVRAALPHLSAGSSIVLVASTAGQRGEAGYSGYAASKAGMIALVRSWASELAGRDIRVNAVAPGWVETEMTTDALAGASGDKARAGIPLQRIATPVDIAAPIVFLLSPLARHMHGSVLSVNGGSVLA